MDTDARPMSMGPPPTAHFHVLTDTPSGLSSFEQAKVAQPCAARLVDLNKPETEMGSPAPARVPPRHWAGAAPGQVWQVRAEEGSGGPADPRLDGAGDSASAGCHWDVQGWLEQGRRTCFCRLQIRVTNKFSYTVEWYYKSMRWEVDWTEWCKIKASEYSIERVLNESLNVSSVTEHSSFVTHWPSGLCRHCQLRYRESEWRCHLESLFVKFYCCSVPVVESLNRAALHLLCISLNCLQRTFGMFGNHGVSNVPWLLKKPFYGQQIYVKFRGVYQQGEQGKLRELIFLSGNQGKLRKFFSPPEISGKVRF